MNESLIDERLNIFILNGILNNWTYCSIVRKVSTQVINGFFYVDS